MPDSIPYWMPADQITCHANAAITGGRFVALAGAAVEGNPRVAPAGAGVAVFGVAAQDAAVGEKVLVYTCPGSVQSVFAPAALAAGAVVQSDATGGAIVRGAGLAAGRVVSDIAAGASGMVQFLPALV